MKIEKLFKLHIVGMCCFMIAVTLCLFSLFARTESGTKTIKYFVYTSPQNDSVSIDISNEIKDGLDTIETEPELVPIEEEPSVESELVPIEEEPTMGTEPSTEPTEKEPEPSEPTTEPSSEPTEAPVKEETNKKDGMSDIEMLACVIYQEAGSDSICDDCRRRVADIVLNRVNDSRFPDSIYKVLTAKNQYGKFSKTGIVWPKRAKYSGEKHAVERAYRIAEEVLNGKHSEVYGKGYVWQAGFKQGTDGFWCCGHFYGKG